MVSSLSETDKLSTAPPKPRTYQTDASVVFRVAADRFGGLSNMCSGFPVSVNGHEIWTSEGLYQACRFPDHPEIQLVVISERSPMTSKMRAKHYRQLSRKDWNQIRVRVMRWCLQVKLAQNWSRFGGLLLATGDKPIVEESKRDVFWAAKRVEPGKLEGVNALGRLLMELRQKLKSESRIELQTVRPIGIANFLLLGEPIGTVNASEWTHRSPQPNLDKHWGFQL